MQPFEIFRSGNHVDAGGESRAFGLAVCAAAAAAFDRASCAVDLAGDVPEWIQLMPLGEIRTRGTDTRGPWKLSDPAAVIKASQAVLDKLPIDYDHQTDFTRESGNAAPAAGWIVELQARDDGIYARVEWTDRGRAAIAAKEYRFISPVFTYDKKTREVATIHRAGLVNDPALFLKALASRRASSEEDHMDELLKKLREILGLAGDADEKAVCAAAETLAESGKVLLAIAKVAGLKKDAEVGEIETAVAKAVKAAGAKAGGADAQLTGIAKALGLKEDASVEDIETAAAKATAAAANAGDRDELAGRLAKLEDTNATAAAETAADAAIKAGKLIPAQRDWAIAQAKKDPEGFESFLETQPVIVAPGTKLPGGKPPKGGDGLTADELALCKRHGLKPEDYKKARDDESEEENAA